MTTGGAGFLGLNYKAATLAYLQLLSPPARPNSAYAVQPIDPGKPLSIFVAFPPEPPLECKLYELWGTGPGGGWEMLFQRYAPELDPLAVLQCAINDGDLSLQRITRHSTGSISTAVYELRGTRLQVLANDESVVFPARPTLLPKYWRFIPGPTPTHHLLDLSKQSAPQAPPPLGAPKFTPDKDKVLPEIEVARYALRTFNLNQGQLRSLNQPGNWDGGGAEAKCHHDPPCDRPPSPGHRCGLYGTLSLEQLVREYPSCEKAVAVFAAEGRTMLGTRGLRTERARIVAYWVRSVTEKKVFDAQAPEARHFKLMPEMLKAYGFEEYVPPVSRGHWFSPYNPTERVKPESLIVTHVSAGGGGGGGSLSVGPITVAPRQGGKTSMTWAQIAAQLPPTMTDAGRKAIAEALGITTPPPRP